MDVTMITLRLIHIVGGVLWAGWAFGLPLFVEPAARAAGPQGGPFMQALTSKTPLVTVMTLTPILVILSGVWLLWIVSGGFDVAYMESRHGITLTTAGAISIVAFVYGLIMVRPLGIRMGQIGREIAMAGNTSTGELLQELSGIRKALKTRGQIIGWLILFSVVGMAISRYVV